MSFWTDPTAWLGNETLWILYGVLALAAFVKYTIPILPGDLVLLVCVFFVGAKGGSGWISVGAITAGGTTGALLAFWWGRHFGNRFMRRPRFRRLTGRVETLLGRWGYWPLLLNRFVPYVRPALFPAAGMLRMKALPTQACALLGNALFGLFVVVLGHSAGRQWGQLVSLYHLYQLWLGLMVFALLSLLAGYLAYGVWQSRKSADEDLRG
jgi:membrane protein DedA with SNARE-associated domain